MLETLVSDLECVDDMLLLSSSWSDLKVMIKSLHQYILHCHWTYHQLQKDKDTFADLIPPTAPTHPAQPV